MTFAVEIGHINAGSTGERNINSLLRAIIDDVVGHTLRHIECVAGLAELVGIKIGHRNAGPLYRLLRIRPVVNIYGAEALVVREDDRLTISNNRIGVVGIIGSIAVIIPAGYKVMTELISGTVHPVTVIGKVSDIFSLSAVAVVQDNADSAIGNIASELGLAILVGDSLSLRSAGPLAVERVAVSIPGINISRTPTEVIGQQEGTLRIRSRSRIDRINGTVGIPADDLVMTEIILRAVHPVAVIAEVCDILGLFAVTVIKDNADSAFGDMADKLGFTVLIGLGLSLRSAGPLTVQCIAVCIPCIYVG